MRGYRWRILLSELCARAHCLVMDNFWYMQISMVGVQGGGHCVEAVARDPTKACCMAHYRM